MQLETFLESKPLFYDKIDYDRFPKAYESIKNLLHIPRVVHLVGTNGKGSTGRFLAQLLKSNSFKVGHYSSPHILKFNERIWLNGSDISDKALENSHKELLKILKPEIVEALSYFEYTTLLTIVAFKECDIIVLEAGLGGEFDATNVFKKELSIFTPIGFDHRAFLGDTINSIATTKLNSMDKCALLATQVFSEVYDIALKIASQKSTNISRVEDVKVDQTILDSIKAKNISHYLKENLLLSIAGAKLLGVDVKIDDLKNIGVIFGRLSKIGTNIYVDVGHNELAAQAIVKSLYKKKVVLVYNSFKDKAYNNILEILKPIIKYVEIISVDDKRIVDKKELQKVLKRLKLEYKNFVKVESENIYLVFGSFSVVETFLKQNEIL